MRVYFHNRDTDGFCSAAIIRKRYPDTLPSDFIGWDYGMTFPDLKTIPFDTPIIIVDISFIDNANPNPFWYMEALAKHSSNQVTWIDHHISAINEYEDYITNYPGTSWGKVCLNSAIAACEATWWEMFPKVPMPKAVNYLGIYDTWRHASTPYWEETIYPFQLGLKTVCNSLETFPEYLLEDYVTIEELQNVAINDFFKDRDIPAPKPSTNDLLNSMVEKGETILSYQRMQNIARAKTSAFERIFEGKRAICMIGAIGANPFESVYDPSKHDIMLAASFQNESWSISLYTSHDEIDVSKICQRFGGGGHPKASGFKIDDINPILRGETV